MKVLIRVQCTDCDAAYWTGSEAEDFEIDVGSLEMNATHRFIAYVVPHECETA